LLKQEREEIYSPDKRFLKTWRI